MVTVYLSAGSNLGDREGNLRRGVEFLSDADVAPSRLSSTFETEPVGYLDQPWFLNLVIEARTAIPPDQLLRVCLSAEHAQRRTRTFRNAPRTLDLDILLYGDVVLDTPGLTLPHPGLPERRFVLEPLAQLAPALIHPVLKLSIRSLLARCLDRSTVCPYPPGERR